MHLDQIQEKTEEQEYPPGGTGILFFKNQRYIKDNYYVREL